MQFLYFLCKEDHFLILQSGTPCDNLHPPGECDDYHGNYYGISWHSILMDNRLGVHVDMTWFCVDIIYTLNGVSVIPRISYGIAAGSIKVRLKEKLSFQASFLWCKGQGINLA
ncbi:hypothetical protein O6P43_012257 [Quillaja saponaria]|uniref:Uncharacterized protein n=1 Tax=Quillaja saponaria TaxID=32244 RepID=A0AAD7M1B5_QUISA|nr:hypothetical protein O6P43_012257 [Quillaja saponaria]